MVGAFAKRVADGTEQRGADDDYQWIAIKQSGGRKGNEQKRNGTRNRERDDYDEK
jgi:hypothetical protein